LQLAFPFAQFSASHSDIFLSDFYPIQSPFGYINFSIIQCKPKRSRKISHTQQATRRRVFLQWKNG
jgi:hypothetical protein